MKICVILILAYSFASCQADISLTQPVKNQFDGYLYQKPENEFISRNIKSQLVKYENAIIKEDIKEGYDYPKPKIAFPLPSETTAVQPTPKVSVKTVESIPSTYLPPETTTTKKPTTTKKLTTTRATTTPKLTEKTIIKEDIKEGYDYPKPKIAFPLPSETTAVPPTPKVSVKTEESIPSTYLPPTIPSTYLPPETTTTKNPTTTKKLATTRATTTPKPTEKTIIKEDIKEGYDYPKPKIAFPLPSETTAVPPTPKVSVKTEESIPSTYLPPTIPSTYLPPETTTTKKPTTTKKLTTTRATTTPKPTEKTIIKEDIKEGYDYPKPKIAFPLPSETTAVPPDPKVSVKTVESIPSTYLPPTIPSTYLPPETTTTKKPTTTKKLTTTRATTTPKPTEKTIIKEDIKEGYDYPKPKIGFPLPSETTAVPPTPKVSVKTVKSIPSTYLPPTIPSTYLPPESTTTKKPTTTKKLTTTRATTTPKPTEKTIIKEDIKEGYDYPKPKIAFPLPSETTAVPPTPKVSVKTEESIPSTYLPPTIPSTYLPPETTTTKKPTTTKKLTTTRATTTPKPTEKTIIKEDIKEGYDYPKPKIAFPLPSETTAVPPTPKVSVKTEESIPSPYLPPTIPSTYLPPETTTTKKPTTTKKLTTTRATTTPKPTEKTIIKEDIKEGYDYPKPKIAFPLPSETTAVPPTPKVSVKTVESIPSTYLPPTIPSTYLPPETTTTKKPTTTKKLTTTRATTTPKPTEKTIIKEDIKEGYDYPKPKIAFPLPSETTAVPPTPKVSVKTEESIPSTYLPPTIPSTYLPPETTTTKKPTTTKKLATTRATTTPKLTEKTIIKEDIKEGYDYPKPKIAFPLPSETTAVPLTPKVSVKTVESIPSTYLPSSVL